MPPRRQPDLFADAPSAPDARDLEIVSRDSKPLGKAQQTFNRLLAQVDKLREQLATWQEFESRHQQRVARDLLPVLDELAQTRRNLILQCEGMLTGHQGSRIANRNERRHMAAFLLELCESHLLDTGDDEQIIAVYDRHSTQSFAQHQAEEHRKSRAMAKTVFGIDIGEDPDAEPLEAILEAALGAAEADAQPDPEPAGPSRRRRSRRAQQREAARAAAAEQAAREMSQSVREVYRKLAGALQPDRGTDAADRQRRHQLMQRVNEAYGAGDLLGLLTLQLEIEQIDQDHLASVSSSRLHHYNQVLRNQAKELKDEIAAITDHFRMAMDPPPRRLTMRAVDRDLEGSVTEARRNLAALREHANDLLDARYRRRWLREYARESRETAQELQALEEWLMSADELVATHHGMAHSGAARRRKKQKSKRNRKRR